MKLEPMEHNAGRNPDLSTNSDFRGHGARRTPHVGVCKPMGELTLIYVVKGSTVNTKKGEKAPTPMGPASYFRNEVEIDGTTLLRAPVRPPTRVPGVKFATTALE